MAISVASVFVVNRIEDRTMLPALSTENRLIGKPPRPESYCTKM
jgi:hypothetical protein